MSDVHVLGAKACVRSAARPKERTKDMLAILRGDGSKMTWGLHPTALAYRLAMPIRGSPPPGSSAPMSSSHRRVLKWAPERFALWAACPRMAIHPIEGTRFLPFKAPLSTACVNALASSLPVGCLCTTSLFPHFAATTRSTVASYTRSQWICSCSGLRGPVFEWDL